MESFDPEYTVRHILSDEKKYKHVYLSETTIQHVTAYMERVGLNPQRDFSKAMEYLTLMSLHDTMLLGIVGVMQTVTQRTIQQQFSRIAQLIAHTAIEAGAAKEAAQHIAYAQLLNEKAAYETYLTRTNDTPSLEQFMGAMTLDLDTPTGTIAAELHERRKARFRQRAVQSLQKPLLEWDEFKADLMPQHDDTR